MNAALHFSVLFGLIALAGCQSMDRKREESPAVRIEFTRPARIYENGDGIFAMMNGTSKVLWFVGQGPESPAYRLRAGGAGISDQNISEAGKRGVGLNRFPLSPGETRYFEVNTGDATGPISVGVTFYPSFTGTNETVVLSSPVVVPAKPRRL
jgi:hypothetical protein